MATTSLGEHLLADKDFQDFDLVLFDGDRSTVQAVTLHRVVLKLSSPFFKRILGGYYRFFYMWTVPPGHIPAAHDLLRFFYTRDLADLGENLEAVRTLAGQLECREIVHLVEQLLSRDARRECAHSPISRKRTDPPCTRSQQQMITRSRTKRIKRA